MFVVLLWYVSRPKVEIPAPIGYLGSEGLLEGSEGSTGRVAGSGRWVGTAGLRDWLSSATPPLGFDDSGNLGQASSDTAVY